MSRVCTVVRKTTATTTTKRLRLQDRNAEAGRQRGSETVSVTFDNWRHLIIKRENNIITTASLANVFRKKATWNC